MSIAVQHMFPGAPSLWEEDLTSDVIEDYVVAQNVYISQQHYPVPKFRGAVTSFDLDDGTGTIVCNECEPKVVMLHYRSMAPAYAHVMPKVGDLVAFDTFEPAKNDPRQRAKNVMILGDLCTEYVTTLDGHFDMGKIAILKSLGEDSPVLVEENQLISGGTLAEGAKIRFRMQYNIDASEGEPPFKAVAIRIVGGESALEAVSPPRENQVAGPNATTRKYCGKVSSYHTHLGWGFLDCDAALPGKVFFYKEECTSGRVPKVGDVVVFDIIEVGASKTKAAANLMTLANEGEIVPAVVKSLTPAKNFGVFQMANYKSEDIRFEMPGSEMANSGMQVGTVFNIKLDYGKSADGELCLLANHVTPTGQTAVPELGSPDSMAHVAKSKLPNISATKGWTSENDAAKAILGKGFIDPSLVSDEVVKQAVRSGCIGNVGVYAADGDEGPSRKRARKLY